jgi:hypothetical protein
MIVNDQHADHAAPRQRNPQAARTRATYCWAASFLAACGRECCARRLGEPEGAAHSSRLAAAASRSGVNTEGARRVRGSRPCSASTRRRARARPMPCPSRRSARRVEGAGPRVLRTGMPGRAVGIPGLPPPARHELIRTVADVLRVVQVLDAGPLLQPGLLVGSSETSRREASPVLVQKHAQPSGPDSSGPPRTARESNWPLATGTGSRRTSADRAGRHTTVRRPDPADRGPTRGLR